MPWFRRASWKLHITCRTVAKVLRCIQAAQAAISVEIELQNCPPPNLRLARWVWGFGQRLDTSVSFLTLGLASSGARS